METRIVIADDHELVRQGMRVILEKEPQWVVCGEARTGRQVLVMVHELNPDLIILDVTLPEINGIEVTRQIRRISPVRVLIVTMHDSDQVVRQSMEAGANGVVLKAEAGQTLADAVRAILSRGEFISERVGRLAACPKPSVLTRRECEVLQLLADGYANKEVASTLRISPKTVETHRARIKSKLELHSVSDLVRYAVRNRIIEP